MKNSFRYIIALIFGMFAFASQSAKADISDYSYVLYTPDASASAGSTFTLALYMKNADAVAAYQTDIYLPEGFALTDCSMGERSSLSRHSLDMVSMSDGSYRILSSSTSNLTYVGTTGIVAYLTISVPADAAAGTYALAVRNQEMTETNNTAHKVSSYTSSITVTTSADKEETSELSDLTKFDYALYVDNASSVSTLNMKLPLSMKNADAVTAFQADIYLPDGFTIDETAGIALGSRTSASRHSCMMQKMDDGAYRIICSSTRNLNFSGTDGTVIFLPLIAGATVKPGYFNIKIKNQEFTAPDNTSHTCSGICSQFLYSTVDITGQTLLQSTTLSTGDYVIYAPDMKGDAGTQILLPLSLRNEGEVSGLQTDIYVPDGITLTMADDGFGTLAPVITYADRTTAANHSISIVKQADGAYRLLCASTAVKTLSGNDGVIAYITFDVSPGVADGNYCILMLNQTIGSPDNTGHDTYSYSAKLTIGDVTTLKGDINGDGLVNIADMTALISYLGGGTPTPFNTSAADVNGDGSITCLDVNGLSSIILNK